jgi:hypothetical protein
VTNEAGVASCQKCGEREFNYKRNGQCKACPEHTVANPQRTRCDTCADGHLQTSTSGQELACNACMVTFKWDEATKSCLPDESDKVDNNVNTTVSKT